MSIMPTRSVPSETPEVGLMPYLETGMPSLSAIARIFVGPFGMDAVRSM